METEAKTVSVQFAAQALGIGRATAYEAIRIGQFPLPVIRVGKRIVIPKAALEQLLS